MKSPPNEFPRSLSSLRFVRDDNNHYVGVWVGATFGRTDSVIKNKSWWV